MRISKSVLAAPGGSVAAETSCSAALGVGERARLLEERRRRAGSRRRTWWSRSRRCPGRRGSRATRARGSRASVFGSVCATSSPKMYIAFSRPSTAASNISGIFIPRSRFISTPQRRSKRRGDLVVRDRAVVGEGVRQRAVVGRALHVVLAAQRQQRRAGAADVAGQQREVADQLDALGAVAGARSRRGPRGCRPGRPPAYRCAARLDVRGRHAGDLLDVLRRVGLDTSSATASKPSVRAADELVVHEPVADDHVRQAVEQRGVGAGPVAQVELRRSRPARCGAGRR